MSFSKRDAFHALEVYFLFSVIHLATCKEATLHITSDQPTIIGAKITFVANLTWNWPQPNNVHLEYICRHDVPKWRQPDMVKTTSTLIKWSQVVNIPKTYAGLYSLQCEVFAIHFLYNTLVAQGGINFALQREIPGQIDLYQNGKCLDQDQLLVSNNATANFTFSLHDPSGYFDGAQYSYSWRIDNQQTQHVTNFLKNFTDTELHTISLLVVAMRNVSDNNTDVRHMGQFTRNIWTKQPVNSVIVDGNPWLKRGEVLKLNVSCSGSPPFRYCWRYNFPPNTSVSNMTCDTTYDMPGRCFFKLLHYFHDNGPHVLGIWIANEIPNAAYVKQIDIHVYDEATKGQLSVIIWPISACLFAVCIICAAVAFHQHTRKTLRVEVADFDFNQDDADDMLEGTFVERLGWHLREACPLLCARTALDTDYSPGEKIESGLAPGSSDVRNNLDPPTTEFVYPIDDKSCSAGSAASGSPVWRKMRGRVHNEGGGERGRDDVTDGRSFDDDLVQEEADFIVPAKVTLEQVNSATKRR